MKIFKEILPKEQQKIYKHLQQITDLGFTLFGGTAIALQLGHRQSIDFDFFTSKNIEILKDKLINLDKIEFDVRLDAGNSDNTLIYMTSNNVKLSFFGGIKFVDISKKIKTDDEILMLADLSSLLVTKLKAICDKSEYKDYIDIYTILKQGNEIQTLSNALIDFPKFFGKDFPSVNLLKNLTYFEDGDLNRLSKKEKNFLLEVTKSIDISKIINNDKER